MPIWTAYLTNSSLILEGSFFVHLFLALLLFRSSRSQMLFEISALKNLSNFTEKQVYSSLFLIKLQTFIFIQKRVQHRCFPVTFPKILKVTNSNSYQNNILKLHIFNSNNSRVILPKSSGGCFWLFFSTSSANCHSELVTFSMVRTWTRTIVLNPAKDHCFNFSIQYSPKCLNLLRRRFLSYRNQFIAAFYMIGTSVMKDLI